MNCPNCGKQLNEGAKFCNGCGTAITTQTQNAQPTQQPVQQKAKSSSTNIFVTCLLFMLSMLTKPFKTFKEKSSEFDNPKNGFILVGMVSVVTMVIRVFFTFIFALINRPCITFAGKKSCQTIDESLKAIDWLDITLKHVLWVAVVSIAIAGIFYLASLVAKKNTKFMKLLTISIASLIPFLVIMHAINPIFSWISSLIKINELLCVFVGLVGIVYSFVIFYVLMSGEIKFDDKEASIYFYSIVTIIILFIGYIVLKSIVMSELQNAIGGLGSSGLSSILK